MSRRGALISVAAAVACAAACAPDQAIERPTAIAPVVQPPAAPSDGEPPAAGGLTSAERRDLVRYFRSRSEVGGGGSFARPYDDVTDLLTNVQFSFRSGTRSLSDLVVVGRIVAVEPGVGVIYLGEERSKLTPFDDPDAVCRTVHLTVEVDERLGRGPDVGREITAGVPMCEAEHLRRLRGLPRMESVVLLLSAGSAVYDYDDSIWAIAGNPELLLEVTGDKLSLPAEDVLGDERARTLLTQAPTLTALREAAARPAEVRSPPQPEQP